MEFVGQLKTNDGTNINGTKSMFFKIILEKIKEMGLKFSRGKLQKIMNYEEARIKLTNTQPNKLKSAAK